MYIRKGINEIKGVKEKRARGEVVDTKEMTEKLLTPAAFARLFEQTKVEEKVTDPLAWEGVECPVFVAKSEDEA